MTNEYNQVENEDRVWEMICQTPINGRLIQDIIGNRQIVFNWANLDEVISATWYKRVLAEQPALADQLSWQRTKEWQAVVDSRELERDRDSFERVRREHLLANNEANFALWRSTHAVDGMVKASAEELEAYRQEAVEAHNESLLNASPGELRAAVRRESYERAIVAQGEQDQRQLEASRQRSESRTNPFPPLPEEITGAQIRNADSSTLRRWIKYYGDYQITVRLRGKS
jgi:hypothetical protein